MKMSHKWLLASLVSLALLSCGENAPAGPDISGIRKIDQTFFGRVYNQCSINNSQYDCNCIARVNVEQRASVYAKYTAEFDSTHKPKMEEDIEKMTATLVEKTMNHSDERVLEALEEDLHRLKEKLENGTGNIDDFRPPFLPTGATESCKILDQ